jgi:hypothetical protein
MNKTETTYYSGQGYIYRCPECDKVDRMPWNSVKKGETAYCRFCKEEFELDPKLNMTPDLYKVIQEINYLETGTVYGASPDMLKGENLVKAGKSVGIDVLSAIDVKPKRPKGDYFAPWRLDKDQLKEMIKTDEGKEIFTELKKLIKNPEALLESDKRLPKEDWEAARFLVLMKKHKGLTNDQKVKLLKSEGFTRDNHEVYVNDKGVVCVFFSSTVAPECDSWMEWK